MNEIIESHRPTIAIYFCGRYGSVYQRWIDQNFMEQAVYYTPLSCWMMRIVSPRSARVVTHEVFPVQTPDEIGRGTDGVYFVRWFDEEEFSLVEYRCRPEADPDEVSDDQTKGE